MAIETELKLILAPGQVARFKRLLAGIGPNLVELGTDPLISVYYDTPELVLLDHDVSLRVRKVNGEWVQTVKSGEKEGGSAYQRLELEATIEGPEPDIEAIKDKRLRSLLTKVAARSALVPVFTTDIRRTRWILKDELGASIEVALDQGKIFADRKSLKINEVELELIEGDADTLFERAIEWAATIPLIPEPASKASRGYCLFQNEVVAAPETAKPPKLSADMSPEQAFAMIVKETLRHFHANVRGVFLTDDMGHVHQARVALRRLRSATKAFSSAGLDPVWTDIAQDLRWLGTELGNVRDLDVLLEKTLTPVAASFQAELDFTGVSEAVTMWRTQHRDQLRIALQSPRYGLLILRLMQWIHLQEQATEGADSDLRGFAKRVLAKAGRQVSRRMAQWDDLDAESRHDLRKRAKKLRYVIEFFSTLYKKKDVKRYLRELKKLQGALGEMNDAAATRMKMEELAARNRELAYEAGIVVGWTARHASECEAQVRNAIAGFESARLPAKG